MAKKKAPVWLVYLQGTGLALGTYLTGALVLTLLLVKGVLPESGAFPVLAALCLLAALGGGLATARRTPLGTLPSAMINTGIFVLLLGAVGLACWQGIAWAGQGGVLLLCALVGGVLAGLAAGRRKRRRKRK